MINGYSNIKPQLKIRQMLERIPDVPQTILSPFVIGPRYNLHRYTNPAEREKMAGAEFVRVVVEDAADWQNVELENQTDGGLLDDDYTKLFGENLEAGVGEIALDGDYVLRLRDDKPDQIEVYLKDGVDLIPANVGVAGLDLPDFLGGRPLAVGDVVYLTAEGTNVTTRRFITGFRGAKVAAQVGHTGADGIFVPGEAAPGSTNVKETTVVGGSEITVGVSPAYMTAIAQAAGSKWNGNLTGASTGATSGTQEFGDVFTVTCKIAGATAADSVWSVSSKYSGTALVPLIVTSGTNWKLAHPVLSGVALDITVTNATVPAVNDRFVITVKAPYTELTSTVNGLELTSTTYTGPRDTTYVITVVEGSNTDLYKPITLLTVAGGGLTGTAEADATQVFAATPFYIPGKSYGVSVARDAAGALTFTNGNISTIDPGETLYLLQGAIAAPADRSWCDGAVLSITDTAGLDVATRVTLTSDGAAAENPFAVGSYGLQAVIQDDDIAAEQRGLRKGDVYYIQAKAAADTGVLSTLVLSGRAAETENWTPAQLEETEFAANFRDLYTGEVPVHSNLPGEQFTVSEEGVLLRNNMRVPVTGYPDGAEYREVYGREFRNQAGDTLPHNGKLFVHYREFIPAAPGTEINLYATVPADAGSIDLENPFAYGLSRALSGAQGRPVYAAPVESETVLGYTKLLRQAMNIEGVYVIAPMTEDAAIQKAVADHVIAASSETKKMWRRAYIATESPGSYARATETDGMPIMAEVLSHDDGNIRLVSDNGDFITKNVQPNDIVRIGFSLDIWGNQEYAEYLVKVVMDDNELLLQNGPDIPITPATKIEIWAPDTSRTQAEYVAAKARNFGSRRVLNVWTERPLVVTLDGQIKTCPVMYGAAELAGLRCALFPQQGLTRTEVLTFAGINAMYVKYEEEDLDRAAAGGTCVITQEKPGGEIFVRHQLTTDTTNGLLYYEDNVGVIVDELSYRLKNIMQQYIGRRNSDDRTLQEIRTRFRGVIMERMNAPFGQESIGAAIAGYSGLFVQRDPYNVSTVNSGVKVQVVTPLNVLDISINASTIEDDVNVTVTISNA